MSKLPRPLKTPTDALRHPRTFFLTSSTWNHRAIFQAQAAARLFVDVLYHYRAKNCYHLHEFVVMPDHFHLLVTLPEDMLVERAVQFIKGGFSFRASKELGFHGEIWERGFADRLIRGPNDFSIHRSYIWQNPVERRLVVKPEDFPYSSAHPGFGLDVPALGLKPVRREEIMDGAPEGVPLHKSSH